MRTWSQPQFVSPTAPPMIRPAPSRSASTSGSGCQTNPCARLKASSGATIASRSSGLGSVRWSIVGTAAVLFHYFLGSGITRSFASRGWITHASTRVFTFPGFFETRCRHPPGS
jgi:hypothetical protein